jgi:hypothetical protein
MGSSSAVRLYVICITIVVSYPLELDTLRVDDWTKGLTRNQLAKSAWRSLATDNPAASDFTHDAG